MADLSRKIDCRSTRWLSLFYSFLIYLPLLATSVSLSLFLSISLPLSLSFSLSLSPSRALGLEPRSRPQPTQKCWDCKACGHFSCRYHQVGGCARLLLAGGMLNITATYSRIISATGRSAKGEGEEVMVVCLPGRLEGAEGTAPWRGLYGKGGRPPRFGRVRRVIFEYVHRHCASAVSRNEPFGLCLLALPPPPSPLRSLHAKCSWFRARHARASPPSVWPPWRLQITNANHSFNYVLRTSSRGFPRAKGQESFDTDWLVRLQTLTIVLYDSISMV